MSRNLKSRFEGLPVVQIKFWDRIWHFRIKVGKSCDKREIEKRKKFEIRNEEGNEVQNNFMNIMNMNFKTAHNLFLNNISHFIIKWDDEKIK